MSRVGATGFVISAHSEIAPAAFWYFFFPLGHNSRMLFSYRNLSYPYGYLPEQSLCQRRLSWIRLLNPPGSLVEVPPPGNFCFHFAQTRGLFCWVFKIFFKRSTCSLGEKLRAFPGRTSARSRARPCDRCAATGAAPAPRPTGQASCCALVLAVWHTCLFLQWPHKAWIPGTLAAEGLPAQVAARSADSHAVEAQRNASFSVPRCFSLQREKKPGGLAASRQPGGPGTAPALTHRQQGELRGDPRSPAFPQQLFPGSGSPGRRLRGGSPARRLPLPAGGGRGEAKQLLLPPSLLLFRAFVLRGVLFVCFSSRQALAVAVAAGPGGSHEAGPALRARCRPCPPDRG